MLRRSRRAVRNVLAGAAVDELAALGGDYALAVDFANESLL